MGIYAGNIDRVTPHVKTGRADYFGQPVNRAARLMSAAHGGQVVCEKSLVDGVLEDWKARWAKIQARDNGEHQALVTTLHIKAKPSHEPSA